MSAQCACVIAKRFALAKQSLFRLRVVCCSPLGSFSQRTFASKSSDPFDDEKDENVFKRMFDYLFEDKENRFSEYGLMRSHRWDGLPRGEWTLVYRDTDASRMHSMVSVFLVAGFCTFFVLCLDALCNDERDRQFHSFTVLSNDLSELGMFGFVPVALLFCSMICVLRAQSLRLFRIYQSNRDADRFVAIVPRACLFRRKLNFERGSAAVIASSANSSPLADFVRSIVVGSMSIGGKRLLHNDDCFLSNRIRSQMLNEDRPSSTPPQFPPRKTPNSSNRQR